MVRGPGGGEAGNADGQREITGVRERGEKGPSGSTAEEGRRAKGRTESV